MNVTVSDNGYATLLKDATDKVNAYSALAKGDLSTQDAITSANSAKALIKLDGLTDAHKATLQAIIDAADKLVKAAQDKINGQTVVPVITVEAGPVAGTSYVTATLNVTDPSTYKVTCNIGSTPVEFKYYTTTKKFAAVIQSADETALKDVTNYKVVNTSVALPTLKATDITTEAGPVAGTTYISINFTGATDPSLYTITCNIGSTPVDFKYYATTKKFAAVVQSTDITAINNVSNYTVKLK